MRNLFALMVFSFVFVGCSDPQPESVTRTSTPHVVSIHDALDGCGSNLPNGVVLACWYPGGVTAIQACINGRLTYCTPLPEPRRPAPVAEPDITLVLDPHVEFCQGGFPEVRLWDNSSGRMWSHTSWLNVPIAPDAMLLEKSIIHAMVFCRVGVGMYEGYMSTSITNSSIGSDAANIGVHVFINGEERPAFICWDTPDPHTDPMLHRIQFRIGDWDDPPGCYAGG